MAMGRQGTSTRPPPPQKIISAFRATPATVLQFPTTLYPACRRHATSRKKNVNHSREIQMTCFFDGQDARGPEPILPSRVSGGWR